MIVIGARGFAKEVLEILHQNNEIENLCFYDDVNSDVPKTLYNQFPIYTSLKEVEEHFKTISNKFIIGIGNPKNRKLIYDKFCAIGGVPYSIISNKADIGSYDNVIDNGSIITSGVIITNSVRIGKGVLVNLSCTIGHDCTVGDFVEICPNVSISGNCIVENNVFIGTSSTILPGIVIGANSIIAAGSVVTKNVPQNVMVAGIPAIIKREL